MTLCYIFPTNFYSITAIHGSYPGEIKSHNIENGAINGLHSSIRAPISPFVGKAFHNVSSPVRVASLNHHNGNQSLHELSHSLGFQGIPPFHPHSLPEHHNGVVNGTPYNSTAISAVGININSRLAEGADNRHLHKVNGHSFDHNNNGEVNILFIYLLLHKRIYLHMYTPERLSLYLCVPENSKFSYMLFR